LSLFWELRDSADWRARDAEASPCEVRLLLRARYGAEPRSSSCPSEESLFRLSWVGQHSTEGDKGKGEGRGVSV
jgi:hypothetical protein